MKTLNIFLKALEETLGTKRGFFVPRKTSEACRFSAYKKIILEVWCIDGSYETLISKVEAVGKSSISNTTIEEQENLEDNIIKDTIKNILKYYGI